MHLSSEIPHSKNCHTLFCKDQGPLDDPLHHNDICYKCMQLVLYSNGKQKIEDPQILNLYYALSI
jgi:hypothetical protein